MGALGAEAGGALQGARAGAPLVSGDEGELPEDLPRDDGVHWDLLGGQAHLDGDLHAALEEDEELAAFVALLEDQLALGDLSLLAAWGGDEGKHVPLVMKGGHIYVDRLG